MKPGDTVVSELQREFENGFTPSKNSLPKGVQVTTKLNVALWLCELGPRPENLKDFPEELEKSWTNELELVSGRLGFRLLDAGVERDSLKKFFYAMDDFWVGHRDDADLDDYFDTLDQYSRIMVQHRILEAGPSEMGEWLIRCIRAGGMPCGCVGIWPQQPLMVYWPHDIPPKFE